MNGSFLALVSDQYLRTTVIAGRPELGAPDWRGDVPGHSMSAQEVSDVVAWLAAKRTQFPGQPYAASQNFQVFAINCAHLGCPVRWFPQSNLFLCPCHGGAYYQDGSRASGPPPRGLFQYHYKIEGGKLFIKAGEMPTPGRAAIGAEGKSTCA